MAILQKYSPNRQKKGTQKSVLAVCRKTNFGTSRTPSPTKAFTKNSQIVGAGVLDSPFFTIIYDFFDKLRSPMTMYIMGDRKTFSGLDFVDIIFESE